MMRQLSISILFLLCLITCKDTDPNIATSVKIDTDGKVSELTDDESIPNAASSNSMDNTYNRNDLISKRFEERMETFQSQILELQTHIHNQETIINELNERLESFVFTANEYGIIYESSDDRPLLLTSSHTHNISFKMLNVMSVRLPKRDSFIKKSKRKSKSNKNIKSKRRKTRYIHVIVTLNSDGIFQLWDDEQNELYLYSDDTIINNKNNNFEIFSDIITQQKYGNTYFVIARNDKNYVKRYAVTAWRNYINDKYNIKKSVIEGEITPENTILRPENYTSSDVTVTDISIYKQQRKEYIIVSYSDGLLFAYKPNGKLSSNARTMPYKSPNKTIIKISNTPKKYQMIIITEIGFQFLKLPKLSKIGPFCKFPMDNLIISQIKFDTITTSLMYLTTTNGMLLVYNTKKLNKKMCKPLDDFIVQPNSEIKINTLPGYLLITSTEGLHVYNITKKKTSKYTRPGLVFIRKFDSEINNSNILFSSYTDGHQRTIIAYAQTNESQSEFVILESYLPSFNALKEKGGILGIVSKAPIFVGIAMFAFFWVFFKGKGGGQGGGFGNSPLGRLGKIFSGGGGRKNRKTYSRGGAGDIRGKKDRWSSRHPQNAANIPLSANMRYGNRQSARKF